MDVEKLIEHLERRGLSNGSSLGPHSGLYDEAADAFTALLAENEKLRDKLNYVRMKRDAAVCCIFKVEGALERGTDNKWAREHIAEWRRIEEG